ncbi:MAG: patatin-like phospholipase family protein [Chthoniobacteraceae bacterium]
MSSRVAVCLNSSFLGFYAHSGFMQGLEELGLRPAAVSGASAGALVAGFLAAGKSARETAALLLEPDLRATLLDWGVPWRALGTMANRPGFTGAVSTDGALRLLRMHLGDRRIEDCTAPRLALSVTNLTAARTEIMTSGPLADFILASGAFPGLFAAREVEGAQYWDGGIANPLPFDPWLTDPEIDTIIVHTVVNPMELAARNSTRRLSVASAFNLSHQIICDEFLRWKTEGARLAGKRLIFLRTEAPRPGLLTARRLAPQCVAAGLATARAHCGLLDSVGR